MLAQIFSKTHLEHPPCDARIPQPHISASPSSATRLNSSSHTSHAPCTAHVQVMISKLQRSLQKSGKDGKAGDESNGLNFYQFQHIKDKATFIEDWCASWRKSSFSLGQLCRT